VNIETTGGKRWRQVLELKKLLQGNELKEERRTRELIQISGV
jgi:hypothetical protein